MDDEQKFQMLCPFCSTPWSDDSISVFNVDVEDQCDSGRWDPPTCTVSIHCHSCKRLMYRKDGVDARR